MQAQATSYTPSLRERLAQTLLGSSGRPSMLAKNATGLLLGTQGMPNTESMGLADIFPPTAAVFGADEAKRAGAQGDPAGAALSAMAMVPGAKAPEEVIQRIMKNVRPARESVQDTLDSNFVFGKHLGNTTVPIESLEGGSANQTAENARVKSLTQKMSGPEGYIERLITRPNGEVIEGQHRLDALRSLGAKEVPVTQIDDISEGFDVKAMEKAVENAGIKHPDQVNRILQGAFDVLHEAGSPEAALAEYELPGFNKAFRAALSVAKPQGTVMRKITQ